MANVAPGSEPAPVCSASRQAPVGTCLSQHAERATCRGRSPYIAPSQRASRTDDQDDTTGVYSHLVARPIIMGVRLHRDDALLAQSVRIPSKTCPRSEPRPRLS